VTPKTLDKARAAALLAEKRRRDKFPAAVAALVAGLFPQQRRLFDSPHRRKLAHPGRRGGKTSCALAMALASALAHPGAMVPVVERTLSCTAADTFWQDLQAWAVAHDVDVKFQHTLKIATLPNGSYIQLWGADTAEAADKLRGGKFHLVLVDEIGAWRQSILQYLVVDVLEPATFDYKGSIVLLGTPTTLKQGFMWDTVGNPGWEKHHWDLRDNTYLGASREEREAQLEEILKTNGWTRQTSKFVREYLGLFTDSFDERVYTVGPANLAPSLPDFPLSSWTYGLGIDVGTVEPCALCVVGRVDGSPELYVVESYELPGATPSVLAAHVERMREKYPLSWIVVDEGGAGKGYAEEMRRSYGIPCKPAQKLQKQANIEFLGGDLLNGRIKIGPGNGHLLEDLRGLAWNDARTDVARGIPDHLPDAFLYAMRELRAFAPTGLEDRDRPVRGTAEWFAAEEARLEAVAVEVALRRDEGEDDFFDRELDDEPAPYHDLDIDFD
jgi:hypothetical protein